MPTLASYGLCPFLPSVMSQSNPQAFPQPSRLTSSPHTGWQCKGPSAGGPGGSACRTAHLSARCHRTLWDRRGDTGGMETSIAGTLEGQAGDTLTFGSQQDSGVTVQVGNILLRPAEGDRGIWGPEWGLVSNLSPPRHFGEAMGRASTLGQRCTVRIAGTPALENRGTVQGGWDWGFPIPKLSRKVVVDEGVWGLTAAGHCPAENPRADVSACDLSLQKHGVNRQGSLHLTTQSNSLAVLGNWGLRYRTFACTCAEISFQPVQSPDLDNTTCIEGPLSLTWGTPDSPYTPLLPPFPPMVPQNPASLSLSTTDLSRHRV